MNKRTILSLGLATGFIASVFLSACSKDDVNEMISGEDKGYKVEKQEHENEERELMIKYPEVVELEDETLMESMNESFKKVISLYDTDTYNDVHIDYTTPKSDKNLLSVLYEGSAKIQDGEKDIKIKDSVNIDMKTSKEITYENFVKDKEEVKKVLEEKLKAKDADAKFEAEGIKIYFEDESVVFYYMPLDDAAEEHISISVKKDDIQEYINTEFEEETDK